LTGVLGSHDQADVDEQIESFGDEGVQLPVFYQMDLNRRRLDARLFEQWRGVQADGIFNFRIPNKLKALLRKGTYGAESDKQKDGQTGNALF
jgi:hypothetical protein